MAITTLLRYFTGPTNTKDHTRTMSPDCVEISTIAIPSLTTKCFLLSLPLKTTTSNTCFKI